MITGMTRSRRSAVIFTLISLILGGSVIGLIQIEGDPEIKAIWTRSIQDAIDSASPGDTISIWSGTYDENIIINKTLTLIGNGTEETTINGGGEGDVIQVYADHVNISGISITNSNRLYSGINLVNSTGSRIINCSFSNNLYGVRIKGSSNEIVDCEFDYNVYGTSIGRYPRDVLLMGNSYTYGNNLDQLVEGLFKNSISDPNTERLTNGGLNLSNHASMAQTPGHQWNLTLNDDDSWDHVILQDQSQIPGFPTSSPYWKGSLAGAKVLNSMIEEVGGETVFLMTWGRRFGDPSNSWRYPDYLSMQKHLENGYRWFAENVSTEDRTAYIAPVGLAWKYIYDTINETGDPTAQGTLFYDLYTADNSHPSLYGSYLAACVIYATLTGDSPMGLTDGLAITNVRRSALQRAAHETVFNLTQNYVYPWQDNSENKVLRNRFTSNDVAVSIGPGSDRNSVMENNFSRSGKLGVLLTDGTARNNTIHHNEFINTLGDVVQGKDNGFNNSWDDGSRGNYWSDYVSRYTEAVPSGEVWDTPYVIDGARNTSDRYPIFDPSRDLDTTSPIADAGEDMTVNEGTIVILNGSSSSDNRGIDNFTWSFEYNGSGVELFGEEVAFNFTVPGVFTVTLTVRDRANNSDIDEITVTVLEVIPEDTTSPFPPDDGIDDIDIESGETAYLHSGNWTEDLSTIAEYKWKFTYDGMEIRLFGNQTFFQFEIEGNYLVHLKVTNDGGLFTMVSFWINVTSDHEPPVAVAGPDIVIDQGTWVTFNGSLSSDNEEIINFTWTVNEDGSVLYGEVVQYLFRDAGEFVIILNVSDDNGNWAVDIVNITVNDTTSPFADGGSNITIPMHAETFLDALGSSDNVGIIRYEWTFFDQELITLSGPTQWYSFHNAGVINITLIVWDEAGNYDIKTVVVKVKDTAGPAAVIDPVEGEIIVGTTVHFTSQGSSDNVRIVNWTWWINGSAHYGPEVDLTFGMYGNYTIRLSVMDAAGNMDDALLVLEVLPDPSTRITDDDDDDEETNEVSEMERIIIPFGLAVFLLLSIIMVIFVMRSDRAGIDPIGHTEE